MARKPDTVDTLLEGAIIYDLKQRDPKYFDWLVAQDRLNTYIQDHKQNIVNKIIDSIGGIIHE